MIEKFTFATRNSSDNHHPDKDSTLKPFFKEGGEKSIPPVHAWTWIDRYFKRKRSAVRYGLVIETAPEFTGGIIR